MIRPDITQENIDKMRAKSITPPSQINSTNEPYSGQYFATIKKFLIPCNMFKPGERVIILIETLEKDQEIGGGYLIGVIREEPEERPTPIPLNCLILPERTRVEVEAAQRKIEFAEQNLN